MTRQLTKDQKEFWEQLTSDYDEYRMKNVANDLLEVLYMKKEWLDIAENTQGFHVIEESIKKHYNLERVHMMKDSTTMTYRIMLDFGNGYTQMISVDEYVFKR